VNNPTRGLKGEREFAGFETTRNAPVRTYVESAQRGGRGSREKITGTHSGTLKGVTLKANKGLDRKSGGLQIATATGR